MPAITVRDVPDHVHRRLKRQAKAHNRSLNGEVLQILEQAVAASSSAGTQRPVAQKRLHGVLIGKDHQCADALARRDVVDRAAQ